MAETIPRKRGGRPFHSILEPYFDFIRQQRQRRKTWQEIAELLFTQKGIRVTFHAPYLFYRRKLRRAAKSHWEDISNLTKPQPARLNPTASAAQSPVTNSQSHNSTLAATPPVRPFRQPNPHNLNLNDTTKV